jgi:GAF domain-containing protein
MNVHVLAPALEAQRMRAVQRYDVLDTLPDAAFDQITAFSARRFGAPICLISIVDHDRVWFKSQHGLPHVKQIGRHPSLCGSAIQSAHPYVLLDAAADPRSSANPWVAGEFGLRFYAGAPLRTSDGYNLGTLSIIDSRPRQIGHAEIETLIGLASLTMAQMEFRLSALKVVLQAEIMARNIDCGDDEGLTFLTSLLELQDLAVGVDALAGKFFQPSVSRVDAVARLQLNFYSGSITEIGAGLLQRICADLMGIIGAPVGASGTTVGT